MNFPLPLTMRKIVTLLFLYSFIFALDTPQCLYAIKQRKQTNIVWPFMSILSDFTNLKQFSIQVKPIIKFQLNFYCHCLLVMSLILCTIHEGKRLSALQYNRMHYLLEKRLLHHKTNFLSMDWKNIQSVSAHMRIDCWGNGCHLLWFVTSYANSYHKQLCEIYLSSSGNHLYIFHLNCTRQKFQHENIGKSSFMIIHCFMYYLSLVNSDLKEKKRKASKWAS